jgi:hypothetical protein
MALVKHKKKTKILPIAILVIVVLLIIIVLAIVLSNKNSDKKAKEIVEDNLSDAENENITAIDETIQVIKETIKDETCEEKARKLIPDRIVLQKNSKDAQWGLDPKNTSFNKWTDSSVMVPARFLRYQLSTGNVYKAEKPLISTTEAHYFIYSAPATLIFEINPILKENPSTLIIEEGKLVGQMVFREEFSIEDIGLVSCTSAN